MRRGEFEAKSELGLGLVQGLMREVVKSLSFLLISVVRHTNRRGFETRVVNMRDLSGMTLVEGLLRRIDDSLSGRGRLQSRSRRHRMASVLGLRDIPMTRKPGVRVYLNLRRVPSKLVGAVREVGRVSRSSSELRLYGSPV
jgi:hypothetical protein